MGLPLRRPVTFSWAVGRQAGLSTLATAIRKRALRRDGAFVAILWATVVLKLLALGLALALVRRWRSSVVDWTFLVAGWGTGGLLTLYGGLGLGSALLATLGVTEPSDPASVHWYLFVWEPVWLVGGLLFLAAAWHHSQMVRPFRPATPSAAKGS